MTQVWSYWLAVSGKWLRHHFTLLSQIPASDQSWVLDIVPSSFPVTSNYSHFHLILHDTGTHPPSPCIIWSLIWSVQICSQVVDHLFTLIHKLISVCNVTCSVTNVAAAEQRPHLTKHHLITTLQHPAAVHYTAFGPLKNNNNNRAADHRLHDSAQSAGCRNSGKSYMSMIHTRYTSSLVHLYEYISPCQLYVYICHTLIHI